MYKDLPSINVSTLYSGDEFSTIRDKGKQKAFLMFSLASNDAKRTGDLDRFWV